MNIQAFKFLGEELFNAPEYGGKCHASVNIHVKDTPGEVP